MWSHVIKDEAEHGREETMETQKLDKKTLNQSEDDCIRAARQAYNQLQAIPLTNGEIFTVIRMLEQVHYARYLKEMLTA